MKHKPISTPESIDLLQRVTDGLRSFSEREKGIERARKLKNSNFRQSLIEREELIEKENAEAVSQLRNRANEEKARIEEIFTQRKLRIDKAQIDVRNRVISEIQHTEGQRRAVLQRKFMQAGKARETDLAENNALHDQRLAESNKWQKRFTTLEKESVKSFNGFHSLRSELISALKNLSEASAKGISPDRLEEMHRDLRERLKTHRRNPLIAWFNGFPFTLQIFLILAIGGGLPFLLSLVDVTAVSYPVAIGGAVGLSILVGVLFLVARVKALAFASDYNDSLLEARKSRLQFREWVEHSYKLRNQQIESEFQKTKTEFDKGLATATKEEETSAAGKKYSGPEDVEARATALKDRLAGAKRARLDSVGRRLNRDIAEIEKKREESLHSLSGDAQTSEAGMIEELDRQFGSLVDQWEKSIIPAHITLKEETTTDPTTVEWLEEGPDQWTAPDTFSETVRYGSISLSGAAEELPLPQSDRMQLPDAPEYTLPLRLRVPDSASILVETKQFGRDEAIKFLNYLSLAWLAESPAGRLSFSFIDPVGLGESFAGLMHLADYEEILINSRIRTQEDQIEARLGELCDHMEKVIQMYLRSDYETITQYNEAAGTIAERYHFVVIADFPKGFSDLAAKRLQSIAASGARCGVFLLVHSDMRAELPPGFEMDDLRRACVCVRGNIDGFFLKDNPVSGTKLQLQQPPAPDKFATWVHRIGEANRDSNRIEVPFSFIAPDEEEMWTSHTASELTVPIGRSGATKLQQFALGKGTCQHALIAGKTGSGKSTLFHILITNLALWADPDEVEFYLIDFKKGVEFKCYADAQLPHARVIAIESDREFGLSVLHRLDEELKHRGELFRTAGVQDVASYRQTEGAVPMPRTLLLIDEFQEFFTEDDQISQQAAVLLDRIVRQGRAFGIHAVLGSQTLGGAFTLARATLGQMTVRIALACNEADAYLIMDDTNPAPRLLTRPGEGIYNDRAGAVEANSPFQVVWLDEKERVRYLEKIQDRARATGKTGMGQVVFEGNAPGDVTRDAEVAELIASGPREAGAPTIFVGSPNAIKGPTEIRFERQSGANLLIVGQRDDVVDTMVAVGLRVLRAQLGDDARLILIDSRFSQPGTKTWYHQAIKKVRGVETPDAHEIGNVITELATSMKAVSEGEAPAGPPVMLFIPSLHRYKKLRYEDDFSFSLDEDAETKPATSLHELICEGPGWGYHTILSLDSYNNVNRTLGRKAAGEFEKKILFQMSASDSASLIDTGAASDLGLNRALYYDEPTGEQEIFRPYAQPPLEWFG